MVRIEIITRKNHIKVHSIITGISFSLPPSLADFRPLAGKNVQKLGGAVMPQFWDTLPQRGAAHQLNFILPLTAGNGKSLADPCPGAGSVPAGGGPCERCCLSLLKMGEKKTVLQGVPGERSGCQFGCKPLGRNEVTQKRRIAPSGNPLFCLATPARRRAFRSATGRYV